MSHAKYQILYGTGNAFWAMILQPKWFNLDVFDPRGIIRCAATLIYIDGQKKGQSGA